MRKFGHGRVDTGRLHRAMQGVFGIQQRFAILLCGKSLVSANPTWTMNLESIVRNGVTGIRGLFWENTWHIGPVSENQFLPFVCFLGERCYEKKKKKKMSPAQIEKWLSSPFGVPGNRTIQANNSFNGAWKVPPVAHRTFFLVVCFRSQGAKTSARHSNERARPPRWRLSNSQ